MFSLPGTTNRTIRKISSAPLAIRTASIALEQSNVKFDGPWNAYRKRVEKTRINSSKQFKNFYTFVNCETEPVGYGTYGSVHVCKAKQNDSSSKAVKIMQKSRQPFHSREVEMLKRVSSSSHCIRLEHIFETPNTVFIVTDLLEGGDLFDFIVDNNVALGTLTFRECMLLCKKMFQALEECHLQNFSHLDIKPENFVFKATPTSDLTKAELFLVDFGAAQPYMKRPFARSFLSYQTGEDDLWTGTEKAKITGTISYLAPEIFLYNRFSSRSDVWSLGVSLFMMLTGQRPFESPCEKRTESLIVEESRKDRRESVFVNHSALKEVRCPEEIVSLLKRLTEPLPENRPSSSEALKAIEILLNSSEL